MVQDEYQAALSRFGERHRAEIRSVKGKPKLRVWKKAFTEPEPAYGTDDAIAFVTTLIVIEANLSIGRGVLIVAQVPKDFPKVMGFAFVIAFYLKAIVGAEEIDLSRLWGKVASSLLEFQSERDRDAGVQLGFALARELMKRATAPEQEKWHQTMLPLLRGYLIQDGKSADLAMSFGRAFGALLRDLIDNTEEVG